MRRDKIIRSLVHERFLITLADDTTFHGLLVLSDETTLVLADAAQVMHSGERLPVDGYLYLDRARVSYMQRPMMREAAQ